ncbi:hypothetical protein V7O66_07240 [Methanolobus sp. ZRKC3]|uniref:hypothetical protein n=1 Tax=Methanolobus sp. ZRKC3 TaxID=3125786 RepID=UPI00324A81DC
MIQQRSLLIDDRAADALPMRFTAASMIILILVALSSTAVSSLLEEKRIHDCETAFIEIDSNARMMSANGAGSRLSLDIDIPKKTTIVLGAIPGRETLWPEDSRNYYISIGNREVVGQSLASYSDITTSGPVILNPGTHTLTLESVKRSTDNRIFVKVYEI